MKVTKPKIVAAIVVFLIASSVSIFLLYSYFSVPAIAQIPAKLHIVKGEVRVRENGEMSWLRARSGAALGQRDSVRTMSSGLATITYFEKSISRLAPNSEIQLIETGRLKDGSRATRITIKQMLGKSWQRIEKLGSESRFEVETPSAVASVRGTVFRVDVERSGKSTFYVFRGVVEIRAGGKRVSLTSGEKIVVPPGTAVNLDLVKKIASRDRDSWYRWNMQADEDLFGRKRGVVRRGPGETQATLAPGASGQAPTGAAGTATTTTTSPGTVSTVSPSPTTSPSVPTVLPPETSPEIPQPYTPTPPTVPAPPLPPATPPYSPPYTPPSPPAPSYTPPAPPSPPGVVDTLPPIIIVLEPPEEAVRHQSLVIQAIIVDDQRVASAQLVYKSKKYDWISLSMTDSNGDSVYEATIPANAIQKHEIKFYIIATDTAGNTSVDPPDGAEDPYEVEIKSSRGKSD